MDKRSRGWCLTINNPPVEDLFAEHSAKLTYYVVGKEVGESGTPHLQAFVIFKNRARFTAVKKCFSKAHIEPQKGTDSEAADYCKKDGDFIEVGELPDRVGGATEKRRWEEIWEHAKHGDLLAIPAQERIRCYSTLRRIQKDYMITPPDLSSVCGVWFHGPSGAGKSFTARKQFPSAYFKQCNKWWDGYQDQPFVIIDDVDINHSCLGHHFKIWADRYSFLAENKGGAIHIRPSKIVITSQYSIDDIWFDEPTREALKRRFVQHEVKKRC